MDLNVGITKGAAMGGGRTGAKVRQVVAIFHDGAQLEAALRGLEHTGIEVSACSLLVSRRIVEGDLRPTLDSASTSALAILVDEMSAVGVTEKSGPILVSAGPLAKLFLSSTDGKSSSVRLLLSNWLIDRHAQALLDHLETGACLLWIRVRGENEERQTCSVLLRLSEHPVQVHDISDTNKPLET